jgi:hypothetical protein
MNQFMLSLINAIGPAQPEIGELEFQLQQATPMLHMHLLLISQS